MTTVKDKGFPADTLSRSIPESNLIEPSLSQIPVYGKMAEELEIDDPCIAPKSYEKLSLKDYEQLPETMSKNSHT